MTNDITEDIPGPDTYESHFRNNGRLRLILWPTESANPGTPRVFLTFLAFLGRNRKSAPLWPSARNANPGIASLGIGSLRIGALAPLERHTRSPTCPSAHEGGRLAAESAYPIALTKKAVNGNQCASKTLCFVCINLARSVCWTRGRVRARSCNERRRQCHCAQLKATPYSRFEYTH